MTRILIIDPKRELLIHSIPVYEKSDKDHIETFIKSKKEEYGNDLERIILSMGTVRIMGPDEPIPIPLPKSTRI